MVHFFISPQADLREAAGMGLFAPQRFKRGESALVQKKN
jgi:hypothetical protein